MNSDWITGVSGIVGGLAVAIAIAWAGSTASVSFAGWPVFLLCGIFAYLVQWIVFVHAWIKKTELYFDLTGSITYIVMVVAAVLLSGSQDPGSLIIAGLIVVWALRLGPFLYKRTRDAGEDRRFRSLKKSFPMFLMTWTLQGTWVFITACCALAAIVSRGAVPLGPLFWAGLGLWIFGFAIEVIADRQKTAFRADPSNQARFINTGLWAWSRHPNYFGEIVLWCGIALMAAPALSGWQYATLISPIFVVVLLTFISGVRLLERRADKAWGDDPDYQAYKRNTPALVLMPPRG